MGGVYKSIWLDNFFQPDTAGPPLHWKATGGTWGITSKELRGTGAGGIHKITASDRGSNVFRELQFDRKIIFEWRQKLVDTVDPNERGGLTFNASVTGGDYGADSYVIEQTLAALTLYRSDTNVLTILDTDATGAVLGTWYYYKCVWDPSDGSFEVFRDTTFPATTSILTATDTTYTDQRYFFFWHDDSEIHFDEVDFHFDFEGDLIELFVDKFLTLRGAVCKFTVPRAHDGTLTKYAYGDWIRVVLGDGTSEFRDFLGRVTDIGQNLDRGKSIFDRTEEVWITATDFYHWEARSLEVRRDVTGFGVALGPLIGEVLEAGDFVTEVSVAASGNTKDPAMKARYAADNIRQLAFEAGCRIRPTPDGEVAIDTSHPSSGVTLDNDNIRVGDLLIQGSAVATKATTYRNDGTDSTASVEDTTAQQSDGKGPAIGPRTLIVNDAALTSPSASADAEDLAAYWVGRYKAAPEIYEIWAFAGHGADIGETVDVTYGPLSLTAETMIVMGKRYTVEGAHNGIRFLLAKNSVGEQFTYTAGDSLRQVANDARRAHEAAVRLGFPLTSLLYQGRILMSQHTQSSAPSSTSSVFSNAFSSGHRLDLSGNLISDSVPAGFELVMRFWAHFRVLNAILTVAEFRLHDGAQITGALISGTPTTIGTPHLLYSGLLRTTDANPLAAGISVASQMRRVSGSGTVEYFSTGVDLYYRRVDI